MVAANLPKMACQLSCGFVHVPFSGASSGFHQVLKVHLASWSFKKQGVLAKNLALFGNAVRTQTLCEASVTPLAGA